MNAKQELFKALDAFPEGIGRLERAMKEGLIHGHYGTIGVNTTYPLCGCVYAHLGYERLIGSSGSPYTDIALSVKKEAGIPIYPHSEIEKLALRVKPGDTPETSEPLRAIQDYIDHYKIVIEMLELREAAKTLLESVKANQQ